MLDDLGFEKNIRIIALEKERRLRSEQPTIYSAAERRNGHIQNN